MPSKPEDEGDRLRLKLRHQNEDEDEDEQEDEARTKKIEAGLGRFGYIADTMNLNELVAMAKANGASDLHLEPGLPPAIRVRGTLRAAGPPIAGKLMLEAAHEIIGPDGWNEFLVRRSYDLSKNVQG